MKLDFTKCKTAEDVEKVFQKAMPQLKEIKRLAMMEETIASAELADDTNKH